MNKLLAPAMIATGAALLIACGSSGNSYGSSAPASSPAVTAPIQAAQAAPVSATPPAEAQAATPATNPVERVSGTVQNVSADKVSLNEGGSFMVTTQTSITRRVQITASVLQPGEVVAETAKRQPDNTLLASLINVFPTAPNGIPLGQRPLDAGNLMTNATIDKVTAGGFTVTFPGGGAQVTLAPDAQITMLIQGSLADIRIGSMVSAAVRGGVAQTVSIQWPRVSASRATHARHQACAGHPCAGRSTA